MVRVQKQKEQAAEEKERIMTYVEQQKKQLPKENRPEFLNSLKE
jgi:hypothetical protein